MGIAGQHLVGFSWRSVEFSTGQIAPTKNNNLIGPIKVHGYPFSPSLHIRDGNPYNGRLRGAGYFVSGVITDSESYSIHWRHLLRIDSTVLQGNILMGNLKIRNIFIIISRIFLLLKHSLERKSLWF